MHPPTHRTADAPPNATVTLPLFTLVQYDPGPVRLESWRSPYIFNAHTDIKELALYVRDNITIGKWSLNLGLRGDRYNGITIGSNSNLVLERLTTSRNQHDRPHFLRPHSGISL